MKFTKIIISMLTVCIIFSGCSVPEITESSEEETFTSEISSEETSSDDYFIENNIKFSKPAVPKIDFEKDFYVQVKKIIFLLIAVLTVILLLLTSKETVIFKN